MNIKGIIISVLVSITLVCFSYAQDNNQLGIWTISNVLDEFGDPTGNNYITTKNPITGVYSDAGHSDSPLRVVIKITRRERFNTLFLIPYLRRDNVPGIPFSSRREYRVAIRDKDGETIRTRVYYDREENGFRFGNALYENFTLFHNILLKGGTVRIRIETDEREPNHESYSFDIINADYYNNAYNILMLN
jgi:hypothetical protein